MRESVELKLGKDFLLTHEIQEIDSEIMEEIKSNYENEEILNIYCIFCR